MKTNFTTSEFEQINNVFGNKFKVRFNKAGNITLESNLNSKQTYTFYRPSFKNGEIIIRSIKKASGYWGSDIIYPLNMKRGKKDKYGNRPYNIDDSYFKTLEEAIIYFLSYIINYNKIV